MWCQSFVYPEREKKKSTVDRSDVYFVLFLPYIQTRRLIAHDTMTRMTTTTTTTTPSKRVLATLVTSFLRFQAQVKLYHWQTHSYSRHKASDMLFDDLGDKIDEFVETLQGAYGRVRLPPAQRVLILHNMGDAAKDMPATVQALIAMLLRLDRRLPTDGSAKALLNLRDEMVGLLQQTQFLFTLR